MVKKFKFKRFNLIISNRNYYSFILFGILILLSVGVYASDWANSAGVGHSAGELDLSSGVGNIVFLNEDTDYFIRGPANGGAIRIRADVDNTNRYIDLGFVNNNMNFYSSLRVANGGNVGIGTTNPGAKLTIQQKGSGWSDGLRLQDSDGNGRWSIVRTSNGLQFGYNEGLRMVISANGVGIGTTSPQFELSIKNEIGLSSSETVGIIAPGTNCDSTLVGIIAPCQSSLSSNPNVPVTTICTCVEWDTSAVIGETGNRYFWEALTNN